MLRPVLLLLLLLPATAPALDTADAKHLLLRTGFGATPAEVLALAPLSRAAAIGQLLDDVHTAPLTPAPDWTHETPTWRCGGGRGKKLRRAMRDLRRIQGRELKAWWIEEMRTTRSPLTERLTLFWHGHFTSSLRKVRSPRLMYQQNLMLRQHALGNFGELVHAVAADPAMILYLDSQKNQRRNPNENFARELLELFTLGEGHYTEQDIKEAARAFTGWKVSRCTGRFHRNDAQHDFAYKTFFGRFGRFDGTDIVDIVLEQPRVAEYVTQRLWIEFISETPDPAQVRRLAAIFRDSNHELRPLVEGLLNSPHFWDPKNRGALIRGPVDLLVGTARLLAIPEISSRDLARAARRLGQDLLDPPNVKGWPGGTRWIDTTTLLDRSDLLERAVHEKCYWTDPSVPAAELVLAVPASRPARSERPCARLSALLGDPGYQLR